MTVKTIFATLLIFGVVWACPVTRELVTYTEAAARVHNLDPQLLQAVVWVESRFCIDAVSPKGAIGLGQLMPTTAQELGVNPHDPEQNVMGAAAYLRAQYDQFQDWELALAAYNAGPARVQEHGGIPPIPETMRYVHDVMWVYQDLKARQ